MLGRASRLGLSTLLLAFTLTACQTAQTERGAQDSGVPGARSADAISFPPSFRAELATLLLTDYVKEATGPATISETVQSHGLIGANASVAIRYPAKVASYIFDPNLVMTRCIEVRAVRGHGDKLEFTMDRDAGSCSSYKRAEPYVELEQMAAKLKACRHKGEDRCLLSTNMPEAQARRLMYRN